MSLVYGRVFPPADVADPDRMPGFLGVLDRQGLVGVATNVTIVEDREDGSAGAPDAINVTARGNAIDLRLAFSVDRSIRSGLAMTGGANDFLQLGGTYRVEGRAGGRADRLHRPRRGRDVSAAIASAYICSAGLSGPRFRRP